MTFENLVALILLLVTLMLTVPLLTRILDRTRKAQASDPEEEAPPLDRIEQLLHDLARADRNQAERVAARLAMMGPGILERLYNALGHADFWEGVPAGERPRRMLEDLIAAFGASAVPRALELLDSSPSDRMRHSAKRVLSQIGVPALDHLLTHGRPATLELARRIIQGRGRPAVEELLRRLGRDETRDTNIAALLLAAGPVSLPALRVYARQSPALARSADIARIADHLERERPRAAPKQATAETA